ncbi:hypothetical protein SCB71_00735 [Herbiconiux sp. KACC 21604]|uniref:hypothetical protein n=1 Tax=unclassified Herbiconiux TaxID=2618217 RepID=UPI0014911E17|nr:hypothetical protein [Herbiconiux sp. SALV-R1]QJU52199.1 hypothetical protein HL652_19590 [Herbiconiux sp. SALV-R1]WPO88773.1 hypothetical protein SCB71_00735 [Herbiconiux sp. KACC 21604]
MRAGVQVRALRDAGVPLSAVGEAVASGEVEGALERHRREVDERRRREDRAFRDAAAVLRALAAPVAVRERTMPDQPYVGQVILLSVDETDAVTDDDANVVLTGLYECVAQAGLGPTGPFWTALRAGAARETIELVCCWPTSSLAPQGAVASDAFASTLPVRTELVATWRPGAGEEAPEGALHPAVVALFDTVSTSGFELAGGTEIRQTVLAQNPDDYAVEVSVTVSDR